jgi:hypothetical protein
MLREAYVEIARSEAHVVNYFAQQVLQRADAQKH